MTRRSEDSGFLSRLLLAVLLVLLVTYAKAGGPKYIVGTSFFTAGVPGQPVTWANGTVTYFTDQGNLSPILAGPDADAFVADAFARWTAPPSVALVAVHGGQLSEDVSGANVIRNPDRSITMPADIQPTATSKPVGVVYDYDGTVTDRHQRRKLGPVLFKRGVGRPGRLRAHRQLRARPNCAQRELHPGLERSA